MIERVDWNLVKDHGLNKFINFNRPVVIHSVDTSLGLMKWSLDKIVNTYGSIEIRVLKSTSQYFVYSDKKERKIVKMRLEEFYDKSILNPGCDGYYYTLGRSPIAQFNNFEDYMILPNSLSKVVDGAFRNPERNIWISPKGTRTALHFDAVDNLNLQIEGCKDFLLFPPRIKGMGTYHWTSQAAYVSSIDPREPDLPADFPRDDGMNVKLVKGEMLYLPYGWWHQVNSVGSSNLNANYWWFPRIKLFTHPEQTIRGAAVLINRMGQHPHKRAEKL